MSGLFLLISFVASTVGAICGIGGGVIIKPTLDLFRLASVSTISFLSACTVLAMSAYNVSVATLARDSRVNPRIATPIAIGSAFGGVAGQWLFRLIRSAASNPDRVGTVQSACLALITVGTLVYTVKKRGISTHSVSHPLLCVGIGLFLGLLSSFLGIGGGPINLVVLYYFFSLDTKAAVQTSLYVILFSQIANILSFLLTRTVPAFEPLPLALMIGGGIGGGVLGRRIYRHLGASAIEGLFIALMVLIVGVSLYNTVQYSGLLWGGTYGGE